RQDATGQLVPGCGLVLRRLQGHAGGRLGVRRHYCTGSPAPVERSVHTGSFPQWSSAGRTRLRRTPLDSLRILRCSTFLARGVVIGLTMNSATKAMLWQIRRAICTCAPIRPDYIPNSGITAMAAA